MRSTCKWYSGSLRITTTKLEGCIDDKPQFKTAKRPEAPGDAILLGNGFSTITSTFIVVDRKEQHFWNQWIFLRVSICKCSILIFMIVTTFRHLSGAYICQIPGHRLSRRAKAHLQSFGFPSVPLVWDKTLSCRLRLCAR